MARKYLTEEVQDRLSKMFTESQKRISEYFPSPELNRKTWHELNRTQDVARFESLAMKYGKEKMKTFILDNQQRDVEER